MPSPVKHTLLVVDDEPNVCESVHDLLRREFRVLQARSANEGIQHMEENEVHIIMTDQRMPQITGVEFLRRARVGHPQAVRMLFTGYADLEAVIAAINQGHIYKFLKKPWQPEELEAAVRDAAMEYDRIVRQHEEMTSLRHEVQALRDRLSALEKEVEGLRKKG